MSARQLALSEGLNNKASSPDLLKNIYIGNKAPQNSVTCYAIYYTPTMLAEIHTTLTAYV